MNTIFTHKKKPIAWFNAVCRTLFTGLAVFLLMQTATAQNQSDSVNTLLQKDFGMVQQFTGVYSSGYVQLAWIAVKDAGIDRFDIERSTDGINFRQIGKVSGVDDNGNAAYTFADILAEKGSNFYRLAVIDKDGNYTYSKTITISIESKGISLMVVYPNPFSKKVQVKISSENDDRVTINIIDNSGTAIKTQSANIQKGDNIVPIINVDNLPAGIYYLEVIAKDRKMRTKLMKQQ